MSELPLGWVSTPLADVVHSRSGNSKLIKGKLSAAKTEGFPFAAYSASGQDTWCPAYEHNGDGVVLSAVGARCGKAFFARGLWTAIANTHVIITSPAVHPKFLWYRVNDERFWIRGGSAQPFVRVRATLERPFALPPLAEQRRIVEAIEEEFSRLDAAEAGLATAGVRIDGLRQQAVEHAMRGDWTWTTLGEIASLAGGVTKDSKRQDDPSFVEVPYLRVANVQRGHLDLSNVTRIRVPAQKAEALRLKPGDVLFNEGGDRDKLGRGWVWSGEIEDCIHQNHVFRARLHDGFEPRFVSWHGNTFGRSWFEAHGRQTTNLASLNLTTLKAFPVPSPPLEEQRRIVAELEQQLSLIDSLRTAVESAQKRGAALRRAILERAFRGELVPQDPADEPASVLLERIRAERAAAPPARRARTARAGR